MSTVTRIFALLSVVVFAPAGFACDEPSICKARGHAGSTVDLAISACRRVGYQLEQCASDVSCSRGVVICRANGYAGSTVEIAIDNCRTVGHSRDVCSANVECLAAD